MEKIDATRVGCGDNRLTWAYAEAKLQPNAAVPGGRSLLPKWRSSTAAAGLENSGPKATIFPFWGRRGGLGLSARRN